MHILCGPARSGKTSWLIERYFAALTDPRRVPGDALWLAPTQRAVAAVRERLLERGIVASLEPGVMTFAQLAQRIVRGSPEPECEIGPLAARRLMAEVVSSLREQKRLAYFDRVADRPGLLDHIGEFIREMKRLEIWPEMLRRQLGQRMSAKDADLLAIYEAYQQRLTARRLYDAEGLFWSARTLLARDRERAVNRAPKLLTELKIVVVDGFADFTHTQHDMLGELAYRADVCHVSLPLEQSIDDRADVGRHELFAKSRQTLGRLKKRHPSAAVEWRQPAEAQRSGWPAMSRLERRLFAFEPPHSEGVADASSGNTRVAHASTARLRGEGSQYGETARPQAAREETEGIEIIAAARSIGEIEAIARRVKRLLVEGDPRRPGRRIRPADVGVVFRRIEAVAPLIREVFRRYGIPFWIEAGEPLGRHPLMKTLWALLSLKAEDWPLRQVLGLLTNRLLRPDSEAWRDLTALADTERVLRSLAIAGGRQAIFSALERMIEAGASEAADAPHAGAPVEEEHHGIRRQRRGARRAARARAVLAKLAEAIDHVPEAATPGEWFGVFERLADQLGLRPDGYNKTTHPAAAERLKQWPNVMERLRGGLLAEQQVAEWLGSNEPPKLSVQQMRGLLDELMHAEQIPPPPDDGSCVRVLSAISVRSISVPYLIVAGLSEKAFPQPRPASIYTEQEYQKLAQADLPVVLRAEHRQQEMLLFYEVLTRAEHHLVLSFPALDEKLEPQLPSPYLEAAARALGVALPAGEPDLSLVPPPAEVSHIGQSRLVATREALDGSPQPLLRLLQTRTTSATAANTIAALEATASRARRETFGPFEGLVRNPALRGELAKLFGAARHWTPSEFETYEICPYRFFAERVLHLEPLDRLELASDPAQRGTLLHEALARVHRKLPFIDEHVGPTLGDAEAFVELFAETVGRIIEELATFDDAAAALLEVERRRVSQLARSYYLQHADYDRHEYRIEGKKAAKGPPMRPERFEVPFGMAGRRADGSEGSAMPLTIEVDGLPVHIAGRIDRLDRGQLGEHVVWNIIDYKSGRVSRGKADAAAASRELQLYVYWLAFEDVLAPEWGGAVWRIGYWSLQDERGGFKEIKQLARVDVDGGTIDRADAQQTRQEVMSRIAQIVRGVRNGDFPVFSSDKECTRFCPFKTVCRIQHVRALEKQWAPEESDGKV